MNVIVSKGYTLCQKTDQHELILCLLVLVYICTAHCPCTACEIFKFCHSSGASRFTEVRLYTFTVFNGTFWVSIPFMLLMQCRIEAAT
jgi:hypothetical protein